MKLSMKKRVSSLVIMGTLAAITGCGGDAGQEQERVATPTPEPGGNDFVYAGPIADNDDILAFQQTLYQVLNVEGRCGSCHGGQSADDGGVEPHFADRDNVNAAYALAIDLVDLSAPVSSRLVQRPANGHNAWSPVADDQIQNAIVAWGAATGASQNEVVLIPIPEADRISAGETLQFGDGAEYVAAFQQYIYDPILNNPATGNCLDCHAESTQSRQQPFFASSDPESAYRAAQSVIDLNNPNQSRLISRMAQGHSNWAPDPNGPDANVSPAQYSTEQMTAAVLAFVNNGVPDPVPLPDGTRDSYAASFAEPYAQVASSGGRFDTNAIALYLFRQGSGGTAFDTSNVEPALDLSLTPSVEWLNAWGLRFTDNGKAFATTEDSGNKLHRFIRETGEYSIEAWVAPANVSQEESRIVTYSSGQDNRNFSLHQTLYDYEFLTRSENSDDNGMPILNTPSAEEVLQATLQHVVVTYDPILGRKIYVNGEERASDPDVESGEISEFAGSIANWNDTYVLTLGNEADSTRPWEGTMRLLAIHNRVLEVEQIQANFDAGVGQKYFMLFDISDYVEGASNPYIVFTVELFDDFSYLFSNPMFINIGGEAPAQPIVIRGMRIGINGTEIDKSQAFSNIDITIDTNNFDAAGVPINVDTTTSPATTLASGTLMPIKNGQDSDVFFLTFEEIGDGDWTYNRPPEDTPDPIAVVASGETNSRVGAKTFDEVMQALSAITTVPAPDVYDFFEGINAFEGGGVRRSMPTTENLDAFLPSHQAAISQLALAYCTELVNDNGLRTAYFPGFNFGGSLTVANSAAVIDPLLNSLVVNDVLGADATSEARTDLEGLINDLATNDTDVRVISVCTAAVASAAMLIQ